MDFAEWEPVYEAILADFGWTRAADERARDLLGATLSGDTFDPDDLEVAGNTVVVGGAGPSLASDLGVVQDADLVFAASAAADTIRDAGLAVDCMVTDLDKNPRTARELSRAGVPVAVHAHGDNVPELRTVVPGLEPAAVIPTTQAAPVDGIRNFGGFTDGDRAAFMADHLDAGDLRFAGWDFDDPDVEPEKARKLAWAERLLYWLERRRGTSFEVLDGRRAGIDTATLPVD